MNISNTVLSNVGVFIPLNRIFAGFSVKYLSTLHSNWQLFDVRNDHSQLVQHSPKALTEGDEEDGRTDGKRCQ